MSQAPVALITGASRGIGAAIARKLAADGYHVLLNFARSEEHARAVLSEIESAGGSGELCPFDIRDAARCSLALENLMGRHFIRVLVNNAGITADGPFAGMQPDAWSAVMQTSLDGFYNVTQPLVMPMARKRQGRIINISSISGTHGNAGQVNYSAAKAGLIGATKALALELAKRKITVNAVAPGLIETDMIEGAPVDKMVAQIPMGRLGQPREVAEVVSFLASDRAAYVTGQVIEVSGGL